MIAHNAPALCCRQRIERHIANVDEVRAFPKSATSLMDACKQENVNIKKIIQLIECDPTIAAKVLALANSPMYGTSRPVGTIGHAVVILGFQTVSKVAISIATGQVFATGDAATEGYRKQVFDESIGIAIASRAFARAFEAAHPDEAFLAGIVQEIGQLIFLDVLSEEYFAVGDPGESVKPVHPLESEQIAFGIDHADVGRRFGMHCGLPTSINLAIANHHGDMGTVDDCLSRSVIVGNTLARQWNLGFDSGSAEAEFAAGEISLPEGISAEKIGELESECRETFAAVNEIFGI